MRSSQPEVTGVATATPKPRIARFREPDGGLLLPYWQIEYVCHCGLLKTNPHVGFDICDSFAGALASLASLYQLGYVRWP